MESKREYFLSNESVDEISESVGEFLETLNTENKNILLIRLSIEEILLFWQEHFSEKAKCQLKIGHRFWRPFIQLELEGPSVNPLIGDDDEYGTYRNRLLSALGLSPIFSYENGKNRIVFKLKKAKQNPLLGLALAVLAGALVGSAGLLMPDTLRSSILEHLLTPIYDTFFSLMGTVAGPMVFLSVAWGIYGIGDTVTFGRIGKAMVLHFIGATFLMGVLTVPAALPFLSLNLVWEGNGVSQLSSLFQMILGFVPTDIVSPFQSGNFMQIIFLGAALGISMLVLGKQAAVVAQTIEQINYIIEFFVECISNLIPYFIFIVLIQLIWGGKLDVVLSAWKPLLVFTGATVLMAVVIILLAAKKGQISPLMLVKKGFPTLVIGMTTASSVAAFGTCTNICENKLGVRSNITSFGVPLGIVMFPPATAMFYIVLCLHAAEVYQVECSWLWFVMAVFSATVMAIAAPPIPGGSLACYTILFTQLGIPTEALIIALSLDMLCDFIATGIDMFCLQLDLMIQSEKMGMLDKNILHK